MRGSRGCMHRLLFTGCCLVHGASANGIYKDGDAVTLYANKVRAKLLNRLCCPVFPSALCQSAKPFCVIASLAGRPVCESE